MKLYLLKILSLLSIGELVCNDLNIMATKKESIFLAPYLDIGGVASPQKVNLYQKTFL